jgi:hypothetical protein
VEFHNYAQKNHILNYYPDTPCRTIVNHLAWNADSQCLSVATSPTLTNAYYLQRYNSKPAGTKKEVALMWKNPPSGPFRSSGFFTKGGNAKGRRRFREKIGPLIQDLEMVEGEILQMLTGRGLQPGADVTVLVSYMCFVGCVVLWRVLACCSIVSPLQNTFCTCHVISCVACMHR